MSQKAEAANVTKRGLWIMRAVTVAVLATNVGYWVQYVPEFGEWWEYSKTDIPVLMFVSALLVSSVSMSFTRLASEATWPLLAASLIFFILSIAIWGVGPFASVWSPLDRLFIFGLLVGTVLSFVARYQIRNSEKVVDKQKGRSESKAKRKYLLRD